MREFLVRPMIRLEDRGGIHYFPCGLNTVTWFIYSSGVIESLPTRTLREPANVFVPKIAQRLLRRPYIATRQTR
jgi:hypothetical protein